jgi:hypothetical protein
VITLANVNAHKKNIPYHYPPWQNIPCQHTKQHYIFLNIHVHESKKTNSNNENEPLIATT